MNYNWHDKKVLIVEDNYSNYRLINALISMTKIDITWAQNGLLAVDLCRKNHYDLILLDIQLPMYDGFETTKAIREFNKEIPIIAVTAHAQIDIRQMAFEVGCNDYFSKPFNTHVFFSTLSKFIEK